MTQLKDDLAALRIARDPEGPSSRRVSVWLVGLFVAAAAGAGTWYWLARERPLEVEVVTVTARPAGAQAAVLNASGYVTARRRATVSSKITGKVIEVNVEEGMAVKEGQILARLDDSSIRAALSLAQAQASASRQAMRENEVRLAEANLTLNRARQLFADKLVTQAEVDRAQAEVDSIEARIAAAREQVIVADRQVALSQTNLDDTIIRAPFSGVAISKNAQAGEIISPMSAGGGFTRTGICTIVDMSSLEVEVDVNESYIGRVVPGQGVTATLDAYPDWQIPARVITTVPTADRQKATVLVRIAFNELDARILPDMGVKVTFLRNADEGEPATRPVALVPRAVLRQDGDRTIVFVIGPDNVVERRAITTGGTDGDRVEVVAGLNSGERVVVSPPPDLADGAPVVVN
jgi:RND family efflux transporter MFP subunit